MSGSKTFFLNSVKTIKYLRIFGYATFSAHSVKDERVFVSKADFSFFFGNLLIACLIFYLSMIYKPVSSSELKIMAYVTKFVMNSASIICIISLISVFCFRNKIWQLTKLIDSMNELFLSINVDINMKNFKTFFMTIATTFIIFQGFGLFCMSYFLNYHKKITVLMLFGYLSMSYSTNNGWIMMFQLAVNRRFKAVNEKLRQEFFFSKYSFNIRYFIFRNLVDFSHSSTIEHNNKIVKTLQTIHYDLIKSIKLINLVFGFQNMLAIGICYLFTFFTFFAAYKAFYNDISSHKNISITSFYWCFYYNSLVILMIVMCYRSRCENEETSRLISKLMNKGNCSLELLQSFGNQSSGEKAKSSCGLFDFDLPLIGMVNFF
ncbi:hypothetical protein PVAND_014672 [Polypedilum vanderplanki]|uniref:Gustatory receptor n=1 Tax=Polypedilum vanderplanki TaxID=319348 RepID=A0A9J6B9V2_POLVA|nr:hypothetical protein PVAND_014672 [Polypedilum vanderplanki]